MFHEILTRQLLITLHSIWTNISHLSYINKYFMFHEILTCQCLIKPTIGLDENADVCICICIHTNVCICIRIYVEMMYIIALSLMI